MRALLRQYWGTSDYRPGQAEAIDCSLQNKDCLVLMPTGGGKSLCYQLPALVHTGVTLVISPLIALMLDQVDGLGARSIPAIALHSAMRFEEMAKATESVADGRYKLLYISPERLQSAEFRARLPHLHISRIAVDEAHCISQWGHDFRPAYAKIGELRDILPGVSMMALTGSATGRVLADIAQSLRFPIGYPLIRQPYERKEIIYAFRRADDKLLRTIEVLGKVGGPAIVYCGSRRAAESVAAGLSAARIPAAAYHAGMGPTERTNAQNRWMDGTVRVIAATNAFGMGIDKPDVRMVLHHDLPQSPEAYYQESGRAGRDGKTAYALGLFTTNEAARLEYFIRESSLDLPAIRQIYSAIIAFLKLPQGTAQGEHLPFPIAEFLEGFKLSYNRLVLALRHLEDAGYLALVQGGATQSVIFFTADQLELYKFGVENPKFEGLLKAILRNCGGCFETFVPLTERAIARDSGSIPIKAVERMLHKLDELGLAEYRPATAVPQLHFITEVLSRNQIHIDEAMLAKRHQSLIARAELMMTLAQGETQCRTHTLMLYFNEVATVPCGHCDLCLERAKSQTHADFSTQILQALGSGPQSTAELIGIGDNKVREQRAQALRTLLDMGVVVRQPDGRVALSQQID